MKVSFAFIVYFLWTVFEFVISQEPDVGCSVCPLWVVGSGLTIATTYTSLLMTSLQQCNEACNDQIVSIEEIHQSSQEKLQKCSEKLEEMEKVLTQMNELEEKMQEYQKKYKIQEQKLEAQAEENEAQSVKISEQNAVITGLQTPICTKLFGIDSRDQTEMDTCFYCIVILNQIDCDKDSKCEFNDGICRPMMGAGK